MPLKFLFNFSGFLDKNRDLLTTDIKELISNSNNSFLKSIFVNDMLPTQSGTRKTVSLSHQFKTSLDALMKTLYACHPFFVRCIKPNEFKKPKVSVINIMYQIDFNVFKLMIYLFSIDIRSKFMCTSITICWTHGNGKDKTSWLSYKIFIW